MKSKYLKGIVAILLALVIELPMLSLSIETNAANINNRDNIIASDEVDSTGITQSMSSDILATVQSENLPWAEVVYENVTIDKGGVVSKVTNKEDQKKVLDFTENIEGATFTFYGKEADYYCKELAKHNRDDVLVTRENTIGDYKGTVNGESVYENDNSVLVEFENGKSVKFYYDTRYNRTWSIRIYDDNIRNNLGFLALGDPNSDGKVTYGEYMDACGYVGYDFEKNIPIYIGTIHYGVYPFIVSDSKGDVTIHLEGRQNVDDWKLVNNYYRYKYGKTALFYKFKNEEGFHNYMNDKPSFLWRYNDVDNKWVYMGCYYATGDAQFTVEECDDGMYVCIPEYLINYGELKDVSFDDSETEPTEGEKINPTVTAPIAKTNLLYSGQPLALSSIGKTNGGTMQYGLGTATKAPTTWSNDVPMATEVGTYYVWYKVVGDGNYNDVAPTYIGQPSTIIRDSDSPDGEQSGDDKPDGTTQHLKNIVSINKTKKTAIIRDIVSGLDKEVPIELTERGRVYRMYDPHRGEHFYTKSEIEANALRMQGWTHERSSDFKVVDASDDDAVPVYRLYNPNGGGMHFYTEDATEARNLKSVGWSYEGISHYVYTKSSSKGIDQYRLYNPNSTNGEHNWTTDIDECNMLKRLGWKDEGIRWRIEA